MAGQHAVAIGADAADGSSAEIALAIGWTLNGIAITFSIDGAAEPVAALLDTAAAIVRPDRATSEWAEAFGTRWWPTLCR